MRLLLLTLLLLTSIANIHAQDRIITKTNDTVYARITKIDASFIYFTYNDDGQVKETLVRKDQVNSYVRNYQNAKGSNTPALYSDHQKFRLAVHGGYSRLIAINNGDIPTELEDYLDKLKTGRHFGADFSYFFTPSMGVGLKYSRFITSEKFQYEIVDDFGRSGPMEDNITIDFIAPTWSLIGKINNSTSNFNAGISIGNVFYNNNGSFIEPVSISGNTLGWAFDFGFDIGVTENVKLGLQSSLMLAILNEITTTYRNETTHTRLKGDEVINISRFDVSIGLRFYF